MKRFATPLRLATAVLGLAVGCGLLVSAWAGIRSGDSPLGRNWLLIQSSLMLGLLGLASLVAGVRLLKRLSAREIKWVLGISVIFSCLLMISRMEGAMKLGALTWRGPVGGLILLAIAVAGAAVYVLLTRWVLVQSGLSQPRIGDLIGSGTSALIALLLFLSLVSSFALVEGWLAERIDSVFGALMHLSWVVASASLSWTLHRQAVGRLSERMSTA